MRVNTNIKENDIRTEIKDKNIYILAKNLKEKGWTLILKTSSLGGEVWAEKDKWLGFSIKPLKYGYISTEIDEKHMTLKIRKITELCLKIEETFISTFPMNEVDKDGFIIEDIELKESSLKGQKEIFAYWKTQNSKYNYPSEETTLEYKRGFLQLNSLKQNILISKENVEILKEYLNGQ